MSDYTPWHVGMKVVCIDVSFFERNLLEGAVYTIKPIGVGDGIFQDRFLRGGAVIELTEVANPHDRQFPDETPGFDARRFRPVVHRPTSISIFTAMLNPSKQTEPV
jgi:hypothetical protein